MSQKAKALASEFWTLMHANGFANEQDFIDSLNMSNPTHQKIYAIRLAFYQEILDSDY